MIELPVAIDRPHPGWSVAKSTPHKAVIENNVTSGNCMNKFLVLYRIEDRGILSRFLHSVDMPARIDRIAAYRIIGRQISQSPRDTHASHVEQQSDVDHRHISRVRVDCPTCVGRQT